MENKRFSAYFKVFIMELKYIKTDFDKFKIEYNGTQFKDINEYVMDLKNIFTQMLETYKKFTTNY